MTQTILVTGANRGIGLEHVRQALAAGDQVIAACRNPAEAAELQSLALQYPDRLRIEMADTGDRASIDALAAALANVPIDILINNAGLYGGSWDTDSQRQTVEGMDYDLWEEMFRVNVVGPFRMVAKLLPNLALGGRKLVVMMSSDLGSITNNLYGQSHAYNSSKAALNMLTKGLSCDLKDRGISVISLAPGWTKTALGGAGANWEVDDSVRHQRDVIASAGADLSGCFVNLLGETLPW